MEKNEKNKIAKLDKVNEEILILAAEGLMCSNFSLFLTDQDLKNHK